MLQTLKARGRNVFIREVGFGRGVLVGGRNHFRWNGQRPGAELWKILPTQGRQMRRPMPAKQSGECLSKILQARNNLRLSRRAG
jgi:hypothetical protein